MKIHEYQAKEILKKAGIPVPRGVVADNVAGGLEAAETIGFPLVVKAQVHVGGRGKAGGIRLVRSEKEFGKEFRSVLGMTLKGVVVKKVLIEEAVAISRQYYLAITVDRARASNTLIVSTEGGIEIEEVAKLHPEKILKFPLLETGAPEEETAARLVSCLGLGAGASDSFFEILASLARVYLQSDGFLAEINPLVLTEKGALLACDAKIIFDDNALFRHAELQALTEEAEDNPLEAEAGRRGLAYVKLEGDIGIIGNGAGLVMATMDEVKRCGGRPANFLDIGGGAQSEVVRCALEVLYMDEAVRGIFVNIFGGITRCDEVARGIISVVNSAPRQLPLVLRLTGTQAEEGRKMMEKNGFASVGSMEEGAKEIVALAYGSQLKT